MYRATRRRLQRPAANALRPLRRPLGGRKPLPPVSWNHWFTFDNRISEEMLKRQIERPTGLGLEYFCIDAGWFEGGFSAGVGNWTIDRAQVSARLGPHRTVRG